MEKTYKTMVRASAGETEGQSGGRFWEIWAPRGGDLTQVSVGLRISGEWIGGPPVQHQLVAAEVKALGKGEVQVSSKEIPPVVCELLGKRWARELREEGFWGAWQKGQKLTRYLTKTYVAIELDEVQRLTAIDNSVDVKETPGVELVHATETWAFWSDGRVTTGIGLPRHCNAARGLSKAAHQLIDTARGSDSGEPHDIGGYAFLATVAEILREEVVEAAPQRGLYAARRVIRHDLRLVDGTERSIWVETEGYFEGYVWDAYPSLEAFKANLQAQANAASQSANAASF